jgi:hypothetical protein
MLLLNLEKTGLTSIACFETEIHKIQQIARTVVVSIMWKLETVSAINVNRERRRATLEREQPLLEGLSATSARRAWGLGLQRRRRRGERGEEEQVRRVRARSSASAWRMTQRASSASAWRATQRQWMSAASARRKTQRLIRRAAAAARIPSRARSRLRRMAAGGGRRVGRRREDPNFSFQICKLINQ